VVSDFSLNFSLEFPKLMYKLLAGLNKVQEIQMNKSALIFMSLLLYTGCTDMVAPTNDGENPRGGAFQNAKGGSETTDADAGGKAPDKKSGTSTVKAEEGEEKPNDGNEETGEADPIGEALNVTGDFTDMALKYIYATHRPSYEMSGFAVPATLTFVMTEYFGETKKVKEYQCTDCDDSVLRCFCAKAANKDDDKCNSKSETEDYGYHQFALNFTAKNALITLEEGQVHQVDDAGYLKKKDYELKAVPSDFTDPNYLLHTKSNQLEGLNGYYTYVSNDSTKAKSLPSVVGTIKFATQISSTSKDFEFDIDATFKGLTGATGAGQALKGKFKGPINKYEEPVAYPTDCKLPEKYVKVVYE